MFFAVKLASYQATYIIPMNLLYIYVHMYVSSLSNYAGAWLFIQNTYVCICFNNVA